MCTKQKTKDCSIKSRTELGSPLNKTDFKTSCKKSGALPIKDNFIEKDIGNGYFELIPKKINK